MAACQPAVLCVWLEAVAVDGCMVKRIKVVMKSFVATYVNYVYVHYSVAAAIIVGYNYLM